MATRWLSYLRYSFNLKPTEISFLESVDVELPSIGSRKTTYTRLSTFITKLTHPFSISWTLFKQLPSWIELLIAQSHISKTSDGKFTKKKCKADQHESCVLGPLNFLLPFLSSPYSHLDSQ